MSIVLGIYLGSHALHGSRAKTTHVDVTHERIERDFVHAFSHTVTVYLKLAQ